MQTDRAGLLYLSVAVVRGPDGALRVDGYPSVVGAPLTRPASTQSSDRLAAVTDEGLRTTCQRTMRNYLARAGDNLAADLSARATVALPGLHLALRRLDDLRWATDRKSVLAAVEAVDDDGVLHRALRARRRAGRRALGDRGDPDGPHHMKGLRMLRPLRGANSRVACQAASR